MPRLDPERLFTVVVLSALGIGAVAVATDVHGTYRQASDRTQVSATLTDGSRAGDSRQWAPVQYGDAVATVDVGERAKSAGDTTTVTHDPSTNQLDVADLRTSVLFAIVQGAVLLLCGCVAALVTGSMLNVV